MNNNALLMRVRSRMRHHGLGPSTERAYIYWIGRFINHHAARPIDALGADEVAGFLTALRTQHGLSDSTRCLARSALLFLFNKVLARPIVSLTLRAPALPMPVRVPPVVLTHGEVRAVIGKLAAPHHIIAELLYGTGLRLRQCLQLRVRDIDLRRRCITGARHSRQRASPATAGQALRPAVPATAHARHLLDVEEGYGNAPALHATGRRAWGWQFLFPAMHRSIDHASGVTVRGHLDESVVQRAFKRALRASGIEKAATPRTLRHSFAIHLLGDCRSIGAVQQMMGHADIPTTTM
ncbi:MAG: tyrosine-type recombinase/integrase [Bacteroidetes bacterium]|nr:tyrosine-type recombinase/integrase [Bacteroidota bacterium]